jgi:outer membrane protein OmpA-like peptidoglycan-associated protein
MLPLLLLIACGLSLHAQLASRPIEIRNTPVKTLPDQSDQPAANDTSMLPLYGERVCMLVPDGSYRDDTPIISADGSVIYFNSTRRGVRSWARPNSDSTRFDDDIYYMRRLAVDKGREVWSDPVNLGTPINTSEDDGIVSISPNGDALYFCSLKQGFELDGGPFYRAERTADGWGNIRGMGGGIAEFFRNRDRSKKFLLFGASIGAYGTVFYFATTLRSHTGGHEIWVSRRRSEQDEWGYPENLGPAINSKGGSYAPFIAADGQTLYFSSGRPGSYGGDDIYVTVAHGTVWDQPMNLGPTINTPGNDAFLSIPASGDRLYYSSNQNGINSICTASLPKKVRPEITLLHLATATDKENGMPLKAVFTIDDARDGARIFQSNSGADGRVTLPLSPGREYRLSVNAPGYLPDAKFLSIPKEAPYGDSVYTIQLEKFEQSVGHILTRIFFEYNSDSMAAITYSDLDRVVTLLREDPTMRVEVRGNTDNVGSPGYNRQLSERRASTVQEYLREKGIEPERVALRGLGATAPLESNATEGGRRRNRRAEIVLLSEREPRQAQSLR